MCGRMCLSRLPVETAPARWPVVQFHIPGNPVRPSAGATGRPVARVRTTAAVEPPWQRPTTPFVVARGPRRAAGSRWLPSRSAATGRRPPRCTAICRGAVSAVERASQRPNYTARLLQHAVDVYTPHTERLRHHRRPVGPPGPRRIATIRRHRDSPLRRRRPASRHDTLMNDYLELSVRASTPLWRAGSIPTYRTASGVSGVAFTVRSGSS